MLSRSGRLVRNGSIWRQVLIRSLLLFCGCSPVPAQAAGDRLELSDRVSIAARIYAAVHLYFAHSESVPVSEIEAAYRRYCEQLVGAPGRREFDLATLRFVASLKNGHTHFRDQWLDSTYGQPLPFRLAPVEGKWIVAAAGDERLRKGEAVRSIDGVDVEAFVRKQVAYIAASNERIARSWIFFNSILFPERITLTMEDGRQITIDREAAARRAGNGKSTATAPPAFSEGRWLTEGKVAWIRVPSFDDPGFERTALDLVRRYQAARCLIVDVRGNGGGSTPGQLIRALMNRPWRTWRQATPQRIALREAQGGLVSQFGMASTLVTASQEVPAEAEAFAGRVILLAGRYTGSAAEDFVMPFKTTGRGTLVGETTQGSSGQPFRLDLGDGMSLTVGAVRYRFPDGAPFEGVGIAPDVPVALRIADVRDGRDPVLDKAVELAEASQR